MTWLIGFILACFFGSCAGLSARSSADPEVNERFNSVAANQGYMEAVKDMVPPGMEDMAPIDDSGKEARSCHDFCIEQGQDRGQIWNGLRPPEQVSVLEIGDSVMMQAHPFVRETLLEMHNISVDLGYQHVSGYCGTSTGLKQCMRKTLDGLQFDVIVFNTGLHDIAKALYAEVPYDAYKANLRSIYTELKTHVKPGGKVIWSDTTPVPPEHFARNNSDIQDINAIAHEVFRKDGAPIIHMYDAIVSQCRAYSGSENYPLQDCRIQDHGDVHFGLAGVTFMGTITTNAILKALGLQPYVPMDLIEKYDLSYLSAAVYKIDGPHPGNH